jgi:hypothetical protein
MSKHTRTTGRSSARTVMAASFAVAGLAITGAGVYAGLNATATGTQAVSSGTLKLTMANTGASVFTGAVSNMAPGDVVNRFVELTNSGTLDAATLTLGVAGTGATKLTTDATYGLAVTVTGCDVAWTVATGACSGTPTTLMASTPIATLSSTPGAVKSALTPSEVLHLKVGVALPDQNETTTNGTLPGGTIQGLSSTLTYTFNEVQRTATTTNS